MTDSESSEVLARTIADKLTHAGGVPAHVHVAAGQIYALLAVAERLDAITARLDLITDRLLPGSVTGD